MEGLAFLAGMGIGIGLLMFITGLGLDVPKTSDGNANLTRGINIAGRTTLASVASGFVLIATGWPVASFLAWAFVLAAPSIFGGKKSAEAVISRSEAIASWIENLHDTLMGSAGLHRAIIATGPVAPAPIYREVNDLVASLERRDQFPLALDRFAHSLNDASADLVAISLIMADDPSRHASDVGSVLKALGKSLREEVNMQRRVHANRASARTGVASIAAITIAMALGLSIFNNQFLHPYNGVIGQLVLLAVGMIFTLAFWYLHRMAKPTRAERFFVNIAGAGAS